MDTSPTLHSVLDKSDELAATLWWNLEYSPEVPTPPSREIHENQAGRFPVSGRPDDGKGHALRNSHITDNLTVQIQSVNLPAIGQAEPV